MTNYLLMGGARQPKGPGAAPEKNQTLPKTEKSKVEIIDKIWPAHQRMVIILFALAYKLNWQSQLFYTPS